MVGSRTPGRGFARDTLFDRLVAHERGVPDAGAPTLRPRLPYAFQHPGDADADIATEEVIVPLRPAPHSPPPAPELRTGDAPPRQPEETAESRTVEPRTQSEISAAARRDTPALLEALPPRARHDEPERAHHEHRVDEARPRIENPSSPGAPSTQTRPLNPNAAPPAPRQASATLLQPPVSRPILPPLPNIQKLGGGDETLVEIHIGRIDVRAVGDAPPLPARSDNGVRAPDQLAAYLNRRSRGARS